MHPPKPIISSKHHVTCNLQLQYILTMISKKNSCKYLLIKILFLYLWLHNYSKKYMQKMAKIKFLLLFLYKNKYQNATFL